MIRFISPIRAIAKTTATELFGQPVIMLLILAGMLLISFIPFLHFHDFGEPGRICRDGALAYQLVIGTIIAVVSASASIRDELETGTALAVLGKPVSRNAFLLGKWLGVIFVLFRFWLCTLISALVAWRIPQRFVDFGTDGMGYLTDSVSQSLLILIPFASLLVAGFLHFYRRLRFCITTIHTATLLSFLLLLVSLIFNRQWLPSFSLSNLDNSAIPVFILIFFALSLYASVATTLSTRLSATPVFVICLLLLSFGLSADVIVSHLPSLAFIPLPNLQNFWMCDAISENSNLPFSYLLFSFFYTISTIAIFLGLGMFLFRTRDIA